MKFIDMFLKIPCHLSHRHHLQLESLIESGDQSVDEITFFLQASLGFEDQKVGEVLFKRVSSLEEVFEFGEGV